MLVRIAGAHPPRERATATSAAARSSTGTAHVARVADTILANVSTPSPTTAAPASAARETQGSDMVKKVAAAASAGGGEKRQT